VYYAFLQNALETPANWKGNPGDFLICVESKGLGFYYLHPPGSREMTDDGFFMY